MTSPMMAVMAINACIPVSNNELSNRRYRALGLTAEFGEESLACLGGNCRLLLQACYVAAHARHFIMHPLVPDVRPWWRRVGSQRLSGAP